MFLIITRNFPPDIGGIQILMEGLSQSLSVHGPIKIFADYHDDAKDYDEKTNLDITRISGIKLFRKYRKANVVLDYIKKNNIRAIFSDHWKSIEHLNKSFIKNIPVLCLMHSKEINHLPGSRLNSRMLKAFEKTNHAIANSNFTKNLAINVGIKKDLIKVICPGVNEPISINESIEQEAKEIFKDSFPKLITVSRLDKRKSHDNVIMSIKNLKPKFPKIKYVSVGMGEEENNLKKLTNEMGLNDDITFLKNINLKLKVALIKNSNLFIMPSRIYKKSVEGFGIAFMEAATYGLASIGGKDGGASDAIKNNKTGLLCDGNDLNSIYKAINEFFEKDNFITFGKAAKEYSKEFHWNKVIKKYLELIN